MNTNANELATIETTDLEHVTGGGWAGDAWNWVTSTVGSMFGGGMMGGGGINVGVQNGNNNRSAQGNQSSTTIGDNSPINGGQ